MESDKRDLRLHNNSTKTSQYEEVSYIPQKDKWICYIKTFSKVINLGMFDSELEAHEFRLYAIERLDMFEGNSREFARELKVMRRLEENEPSSMLKLTRELEDKYSDLVAFARKDLDKIRETSSSETYTKVLEFIHDVEERYFEEVQELRYDKDNWAHGYNSGALAILRLINDNDLMMVDYPNLDT